ncbi:SUN domain-containing protein 1-like [Octopus sinensis]|uniref:SUN domain-containing protein 1-like n=1 Tax=Octopus sinensis TaxID=2607531 RepID=A0A7E6EHR4_9MOLL|nr:SUN domain-containing protein 1-like [Octopus sinensis]
MTRDGNMTSRFSLLESVVGQYATKVDALGDQIQRLVSANEALVLEMGRLKMDVSSMSEVREVVRAAIEKYDSDKTGRKDYALHSAGGHILSSSKPYSDYYEAYSFFGSPPSRSTPTPPPDTLPGNCWAMDGSGGFIVIGLARTVQFRAFSVEHASPLLTTREERTSAPRELSVFTLTTPTDDSPRWVGDFAYDLDSSVIQTFDLDVSECCDCRGCSRPTLSCSGSPPTRGMTNTRAYIESGCTTS